MPSCTRSRQHFDECIFNRPMGRGRPRGTPHHCQAPGYLRARVRERQLFQELNVNPRQFLYNRVRSAIGFWRQLGASSEVLRWIHTGVPLVWHRGPPQPFHHGDCRISGEPLHDWLQLRARYLRSGAIRPARDPRFVSRAFLIPKKDGGWRLCVDLRHLN